MSLPLRILLHVAITTLLFWALDVYLPQYVGITGGWPAYLILGIILALLNILVRPLLDLIAAPIKFIAGLIALILVNGVFLWLLVTIAEKIDPDVATFEIRGGVLGWIVVAVIFALLKTVLRMLIPKKS